MSYGPASSFSRLLYPKHCFTCPSSSIPVQAGTKQLTLPYFFMASYFLFLLKFNSPTSYNKANLALFLGQKRPKNIGFAFLP